MYCYNLLLYIAAAGVPGGGPGGVRGAGMSGGVIGGVPGGVPGRFSNSSGGVLGKRTPPGNHLPCADGGVSGDIGLSLTSIHDPERASQRLDHYELWSSSKRAPEATQRKERQLGPTRFRRRFRNGHIRPQKGKWKTRLGWWETTLKVAKCKGFCALQDLALRYCPRAPCRSTWKGNIFLKRESGRRDWDDGRQLLKLQNAKVSVHFRTWPSDTALELHVVWSERAIFL